LEGAVGRFESPGNGTKQETKKNGDSNYYKIPRRVFFGMVKRKSLYMRMAEKNGD
jgi:hypothetical protein